MKARQANDVCYCTVDGGHNPFNFDGIERTELAPELGRSALEFDVVKTPLCRTLANGETQEIDGLFCLTKSTDESLIPSRGVSKTFEPVQHHEVFDWVYRDIIPNAPAAKLETCGTIYGGSTGLMTFKVGDLFGIKGDKSPSEMRLFISNPTNGSGSLTMGFTTVRLFCQNQIAAAKRQAKEDGFRIRHTKECRELIGDAVRVIAAQVKAAQDIRLRCERLAEIGVSVADFEKCLDSVYPIYGLEEGSVGWTRMKKLRDAAVAEFESGHTAQTMEGKTGWSAFNSFTYPIFNPEKVGAKIDLADVQYRGMNGTKADRVSGILAKVERALVAA